jgi:hypothetical protein
MPRACWTAGDAYIVALQLTVIMVEMFQEHAVLNYRPIRR